MTTPKNTKVVKTTTKTKKPVAKTPNEIDGIRACIVSTNHSVIDLEEEIDVLKHNQIELAHRCNIAIWTGITAAAIGIVAFITICFKA